MVFLQEDVQEIAHSALLAKKKGTRTQLQTLTNFGEAKAKL